MPRVRPGPAQILPASIANQKEAKRVGVAACCSHISFTNIIFSSTDCYSRFPHLYATIVWITHRPLQSLTAVSALSTSILASCHDACLVEIASLPRFDHDRNGSCKIVPLGQAVAAGSRSRLVSWWRTAVLKTVCMLYQHPLTIALSFQSVQSHAKRSACINASGEDQRITSLPVHRICPWWSMGNLRRRVCSGPCRSGQYARFGLAILPDDIDKFALQLDHRRPRRGTSTTIDIVNKRPSCLVQQTDSGTVAVPRLLRKHQLTLYVTLHGGSNASIMDF